MMLLNSQTIFRARSWLALALGLAVWSASADEVSKASASDLPEVTVVAPRPVTAEQIAGNSVPTFVRAHGNPSFRTGQLSRWETGICASTSGLAQNFTDFVTARVQTVAAAIYKQPAMTSPCKPNVLLVFTTAPQQLLDNIATKQPQLLGFHFVSEVPKLKTVNRPIQAWYVTASRSGADVAIDDIWGGAPIGPRLGSRIYTQVQSSIVFVLIVVDTNKVTDYPIGAISDYVAVLALTKPRAMDRCGKLPSIFDLMAPDCKTEKADSITAGDVAYLRALYKIYSAQTLGVQQSAIANIMMNEFKSP
jgi:hypothetical protein